MRLPVSWLKKYLKGGGPAPEKLAELLTLSGTAVDRVEGSGVESILDIEVTTNRPDCLSVLGLAREVSALTDATVLFPKISASKSKKLTAFKVQVLDKKGCPFYTARLIENVRIAPAPEEAARLVSLAGARPISGIVDATNFVLFETGQPLHAFDADKLDGKVLIIRRAKKGEKFLAIDGGEYTLDDETLVIADASRPVAIAGVMGGKLTEITPQTKNVLLESAYFDPATVRRAAKRYKISTESSYRFERGVDIQKVEEASRRTRDLILEWAGGQENGFAALGTDQVKPSLIGLRESRIEALLGMKVSLSRATQILKRLGFSAKNSGKGKLLVSTWNARRDVTQEADLIEEILRIEGFDKIPVKIPLTRHASFGACDAKALRVLELKKFIAALGFNEIVSYSLLSRKALEDSGHDLSNFKPHRLVNTPSAEQEFFRPNLFAGTLQAISFNFSRKAASTRFFEVGNCVLNNDEETMCALSLCGPLEENWLRKSDSSYYDLKGIAENLMRFLNVKDLQWKETSANALFSVNSELWAGEKRIGGIGIAQPSVLGRWDIPQDVYYFQCSLDKISSLKPAETFRVRPVAKFPLVRRDVAFIVDDQVTVASLEAAMRSSGSSALADVRLFDQFTGKNIPKGKRSLAFALFYQKESGTFTDEEIRSLQDRVGASLKENYRVEFR